ncbi:MAG: CrcB family protein [Pseudomonadota bacterium]
MIDKIALVAAGGAIGATLRYLGAAWAARLLGAGFMGTLFVNVVGSTLMGVLAVLLMEKAPGTWQRWAPLIITGVLGGFTTFSAFSLDALYLLERGRIGAGLSYIGASVLLSIIGLYTGMVATRALS